MKKAIYTVITNNYDKLNIPKVSSRGWDFICFTDNPNLTSKVWKIIYIDKPSRHLQREIKIKPHEFLKDYELTIYIDGSMSIKRDLAGLVSLSDITFIQHPHRNCVYEEETAVIEIGKDIAKITNRQISKYKKSGMPSNYGMYQTGIIVRRNTQKVRDFCDLWWSELYKHSHRDQLSVMYAKWKSGIDTEVLPWKTMYRFVTIMPHENPYVPETINDNGLINVIYSTPARSDKNIGKAYNDFMETVPAGAWVCLRDGDTMFTTSDWPKHIEDIIAENGDKYDLIGCKTNRLRGEHQLIDGMFEEDSITAHINKAKEIRSNEVEPSKAIAGLCLIFKKDLWNKVKFRQNSITFDTHFCQDAKKVGARIGIATGLYIFHLYRWGQKDPKNYIKHLV